MEKTPETYRDIKITKKFIRCGNGRSVPQMVLQLQCEMRGHLLHATSWRALELQIDEQLDRSALPQSAQ